MQNLTAVQNEVDFTRFILTKGGDTPYIAVQDLVLPASIRLNQAPDRPCAIIAIQVDPVPLRHSPTIDISARDRAALVVAIFGNRRNKAILGTPVIRMCAFEDVPAKIHPARCACGDEVDLFPLILPYIADVQIAGRPVEGKTPGVTQAISPNLVSKRII